VAGRPLAPNPAGAHFLRDRKLITQLARVSGARTGGLVFDLGAGSGAITGGLAATGARVIAVERDSKLAARLRRRFGEEPNVRVVEADLRTIPLPRRDFLVVASPPFSVTSALCRRLLGDPAVPLAGAELIVEWGAARRLAAQRPRDAETAWWSARYQMRIARVINSASFAPPPRVHTAWLSVRPRAVPVSARGQRWLRAALESAYRRPGSRTEGALTCGRRVLLRAGLDPAAPVNEVTADQWHRLAVLLGGGSIGTPGARARSRPSSR
jgi:23S rRNA (adenine-N6)-dimethyltransferase